jgi:hypothetical protein
MKTHTFPFFTFLFSLLILLYSCATAAPSTPASGMRELDLAIRDASDYLNDNIPRRSKIVILNIQSASTALSDYIIDELISNAVNDRIFTVVDRAQLDAIRAELQFQSSGEVSDQTAIRIGQFLGAQTIVSGTISEIADLYRMRIRALDVQTAQVQGQYNRNITANPSIAAMMRGTSSSNNRTQTGTTQATASRVYKIGDTGPAGGLIFYDKGNNRGGWRYLEAAPADLGPSPFLTENPDSFPAKLKEQWDKTEGENGRGIGKGKYNTEYIMEVAQARGGFNWAVRLCDNYELNGFDDWFLPSRDELNFMYGNLYMKGLGNFRQEQYWSSTSWTDTWGSYRAWYINFDDGKHDTQNASQQRRSRPIRQF